MTLREILDKVGINYMIIEPPHDVLLNYEVVVHEPGERADNVVSAEVVHEVKSIYLEYD